MIIFPSHILFFGRKYLGKNGTKRVYRAEQSAYKITKKKGFVPPGWKSMYCVTLYTFPRIASQASSHLQCLANSLWLTGCTTPPFPAKSQPELPNRIQSINEWPGFRAHLLRGLPVKKCKNMPDNYKVFRSEFMISIIIKKKFVFSMKNAKLIWILRSTKWKSSVCHFVYIFESIFNFVVRPLFPLYQSSFHCVPLHFFSYFATPQRMLLLKPVFVAAKLKIINQQSNYIEF